LRIKMEDAINLRGEKTAIVINTGNISSAIDQKKKVGKEGGTLVANKKKARCLRP